MMFHSCVLETFSFKISAISGPKVEFSSYLFGFILNNKTYGYIGIIWTLRKPF